MVDIIFTQFVYPYVSAVVSVFKKIPVADGVNYLSFRIALIIIGVLFSAFLAYVKHPNDNTSSGGNSPKGKE